MYLCYDNHLSYEKAEVELGIQRPSLRLTEERLRWTGHMLRSVDSVLYEVLVFIPEGGARGRGRPRRRFSDTIKKDLSNRNVNIRNTEHRQLWAELAVLAADRLKWQSTVVRGRR